MRGSEMEYMVEGFGLVKTTFEGSGIWDGCWGWRLQAIKKALVGEGRIGTIPYTT